MKILNVLNDNIGYVELQDVMGNDLAIVNAARTSYLSDSKGDDADKKLLHYLWNHSHHSPFEMAELKFLIKMPIFIARQFFRHRTLNVNEQSRRYTSDNIEFYFPTDWRLQDTVNKQGSFPNKSEKNRTLNWDYEGVIRNAIAVYNRMIDYGVAREQARLSLPVSLYTTAVVKCDLRNWLHFCELRSDSHAQWEIQQYSNAILHKVIKVKFPWTYEVFIKSNENLRVADEYKQLALL